MIRTPFNRAHQQMMINISQPQFVQPSANLETQKPTQTNYATLGIRPSITSHASSVLFLVAGIVILGDRAMRLSVRGRGQANTGRELGSVFNEMASDIGHEKQLRVISGKKTTETFPADVVIQNVYQHCNQVQD